MIRACDGTDPNLTREIPEASFHAGTMVLSPWNNSARPGMAVIQCNCGLRFDDEDRMAIYPHHPTGGVGRSGLDRVSAAVRLARGGDAPAQIQGYA